MCWSHLFYPQPLWPGIFSLDLYLEHPSSFWTCMKNRALLWICKSGGRFGQHTVSRCFPRELMATQDLHNLDTVCFSRCTLLHPIHVRHSLMKWLSKTRCAFSCLLSSFTCYFHSLEHLVYHSVLPCLLNTYWAIYWLAWVEVDSPSNALSTAIMEPIKQLFIPWSLGMFSMSMCIRPPQGLRLQRLYYSGHIWEELEAIVWQ